MTRKGSGISHPSRYALRRKLYQVRELSQAGPTKTQASAQNPDETSAPVPSIEEFQQLREAIVRQRAEFDNFRKRTEREKIQVRELAAEGLLTRLLPVLDNLDRAMQSSENAADVKSVRDGVLMIVSQLERALEAEGLKQVSALNEPFDPSRHDALATEPRNDVTDGHICEVLLPGYTYKEKLLRPAMVKVAKKS